MPLGKSILSGRGGRNLLKDEMGKCEGCEGGMGITGAVLDTSWPWIQLRIPTDTASVFPGTFIQNSLAMFGSLNSNLSDI